MNRLFNAWAYNPPAVARKAFCSGPRGSTTTPTPSPAPGRPRPAPARVVIQACQTARWPRSSPTRALHPDASAPHQRARSSDICPLTRDRGWKHEHPSAASDPDRGRLYDLVLRAAPVPLDRVRRAVPLKPEGYKLKVPFTRLPSSRRVPTCGSRVFRSADLERRAHVEGHAEATLELDSAYAPIPSRHAGRPAPEDPPRRDLRRAVPGLRGGRAAAGGRRSRRRRSADRCSSTRSSAPSTRAPRTPSRLDAGSGRRVRGRGDDFSAAIASLTRSPTRPTACCACSTPRSRR